MDQAVPSSDETVHQDQLTMEQMDSIQASVAQAQPMVGKEVPVDSLLELYKDAHLPGFALGIAHLHERFHRMRQVRGDGNCFYRAFWFGYLSALLQAHLEASEAAAAELQRVTERVRGSLAELVALGYPEFAIESFHEELLEILQTLFEQSLGALEAMFQEGGKADYLTWYMRLLTAGHLKAQAERFLPFVEGCFVDMDAYCRSEVEPMGRECEQLQVLALTEYLGVQADIAYLDGRFSEAEGVSRVLVPEGAFAFTVHLLYRPGHYDLLLCR